MKLLILKGPRLTLYTPQLEDAQHHVGLFSDPKNYEFEPNKPANPTVALYETRIEKWQKATEAGESAYLVIKENEEGRRVGICGFNAIFVRDGLKYADAGVMVAAEETRKGYAMEAVRIMLEYGFKEAGLDRVQFETMTVNKAFRGLMGKCGIKGGGEGG